MRYKYICPDGHGYYISQCDETAGIYLLCQKPGCFKELCFDGSIETKTYTGWHDEWFPVMPSPPDYYEKKKDKGKLRWDLLDLKVIESIVEVLTFGLEKYDKDSWKDVDDAKARYHAAEMRHKTARLSGENIDPESGKPHSWHELCNMYFQVYFDKE